jgi:hypothetical protein
LKWVISVTWIYSHTEFIQNWPGAASQRELLLLDHFLDTRYFYGIDPCNIVKRFESTTDEKDPDIMGPSGKMLLRFQIEFKSSPGPSFQPVAFVRDISTLLLFFLLFMFDCS